jgi:ankyrin repeat protein
VARKQPKRKPRPGVDEYGRTPLHYAAADGKVDHVVKHLKAGANPNLQDDNGWSPLHFAAQAVSPGAAEALLAAGADTGLRDSFATPRFLLQSFRRKVTVRLSSYYGVRAPTHMRQTIMECRQLAWPGRLPITM